VTRLPSILKLSMPAQMNDTGLPLSGLALRWIDQTMSHDATNANYLGS